MVTSEDEAETETVPEQRVFVEDPDGEDTGTCGVNAGAVALRRKKKGVDKKGVRRAMGDTLYDFCT